MKYELNEIMTMSEIAEKYFINIETIKNKFKTSLVGSDKINEWTDKGLIRKSGKTWLITEEFVNENFDLGGKRK